jgi:hypothetical protein
MSVFMKRLFISYSREDEIFARLLACDISQQGADVWIDVEKIPAGRKWKTVIREGLNHSNAMLVIMTPESIASEPVQSEWKSFIRAKKLIIPILWRAVEVPEQLARFQYINFQSQAYNIAREILFTTLRVHGVLRVKSALRNREELPVTQLARDAHNISIVSISSGSFADDGAHRGVLYKKIVEEDCKVRMLIVDNEAALKHWAAYSLQREGDDQLSLQRTLDTIKRIKSNPKSSDNFEVKCLDFHFAYNLFGVNFEENNDTSFIILGLYPYGDNKGQKRPHLLITKRDDPEWFEFYHDQFNNAWGIGKPYKLD